MNDMSATARLFTLAGAITIMSVVFQLVVLSTETLPDVKIARALEVEARAAAFSESLVAVAQPASAPH